MVRGCGYLRKNHGRAARPPWPAPSLRTRHPEAPIGETRAHECTTRATGIHGAMISDQQPRLLARRSRLRLLISPIGAARIAKWS